MNTLRHTTTDDAEATRLAAFLKQTRLALNMTQAQVAEDLYVTPGYISNIENARTAISLRILIYFAEKSGVSLEDYISGVSTPCELTSLECDIRREIEKMDADAKKKLLQVLKILNDI